LVSAINRNNERFRRLEIKKARGSGGGCRFDPGLHSCMGFRR
jgi:hypothetical protein